MKYIATVVLLLFISGCGLKPSIDDPKLSDAQLDLEKFLVGDLVAYGQFQDVLGNVSRRFVVDMNSLENQDLSGDSKSYLENHLRSEDFFGVEKHPTALLTIASAKMDGENKHNIEGYLTIKGITHPLWMKAKT